MMECKATKNTFTSSQLSCYYYNATSIRNKLADFNSHFSQGDYDMIAVTESWFNDSVFDAQVLKNCDLQIFRRDRSSENSVKDDGGGVMLSVSDTLTAKSRDDLTTNMEILWVEIIHSKTKSTYVAVVYIPTATTEILQLYENSLDKVRNIMKNDDSMVIFGDFNCRDLRWQTQDHCNAVKVRTDINVSNISNYLLEISDSHSLMQYNCHATHDDNALHLVFGSNTDMS